MRLAPDDLARPAAAGAARIARALLAEADAAAARLADGRDPEALHDLRVAVRRLRTVLRGFRPALRGAVKRRHRRRLAALARATGAARDAEVRRAWLEAERPALAPHERPAIAWLEGRLAPGAAAPGPARVAARERKLAGKLRRRLARARRAAREGGAPGGALGPALAALLRPSLAAFVSGTGALAHAGEVDAAHAARIEGKRLRYLLEPLRGTAGADARRAVGRLRSLQELLGELHDAHVLEADLRAALAGADAEGVRPGLLALAARAAARREAAFAALVAARADGALEALAREVEGLAAALGGSAPRDRRARAGRAPAARRMTLPRAAASTIMRRPSSRRTVERR